MLQTIWDYCSQNCGVSLGMKVNSAYALTVLCHDYFAALSVASYKQSYSTVFRFNSTCELLQLV